MVNNYSFKILLLLILNVTALNSYAQQTIFWSDNSDQTIKSSNFNQSTINTIVSLGVSEDAVSLAIDDINQKLYWAAFGLGEIRRSNLDGTNIESLITGVPSPTSVVIDSVNSKIYWTDSSGIKRANIDGTGSVNLKPISPPIVAGSIAVDPNNNLLFWAEKGISSASLYNLDITNVANINSLISVPDINGLVINYPTPSLMWFNIGSLRFQMMNYNGTGLTDALTLTGSEDVKDAEIDYPETAIYYADSGRSAIFRLNLNTLTEQNFISASSPSGIALSCGRFALDTDSDGTSDCREQCINDPLKIDPGVCGCGITDSDSDSDGTLDCVDNCPADVSKVDPGICGCGTADQDSDKDSSLDCNDNCPLDARKTEPGVCGCGLIESIDSNGAVACDEFRRLTPNTKIQIPPAVVTTNDNARIIMEKFSGFRRGRRSSRSFTNQSEQDYFMIQAVNGTRSKATIRYDAFIRPVNSDQSKRKRLTSKRNVLTFRNLKPNNYQVRYRVLTISEGRVIGRTNFSPKNTFEITSND